MSASAAPLEVVGASAQCCLKLCIESRLVLMSVNMDSSLLVNWYLIVSSTHGSCQEGVTIERFTSHTEMPEMHHVMEWPSCVYCRIFACAA